MELGARVRLFDAGQRQVVWLPPPTNGPVVVRFTPRDAESLQSVDGERGVVLAEALCRLLVWKGYRVRTQDKPRRNELGDGTCPAAARGNSYCIDVLTSDRDSSAGQGLELQCHVLVGPVLVGIRCMYARHKEHGVPTLAALAKNRLVSDFRFAMLAAGHYRHPRGFYCGGVQSGSCFDDARTARRRFERLVRRAGPLPEVRSYAEAAHALASGAGRRHLDLVDQAISDNLHTPRALHTLYATLRRAQLSRSERAVLGAMAHLFVPTTPTGARLENEAP